MDLRSENPYWLLKNGLVRDYTSLDRNISTDVLVIGAGISGALVAWYLSQKGIPLVVVDRRHVAMGSTAASTSLLQYEIDIPLVDLVTKVGQQNAARSYLLCLQAIDDLGTISNALKKDVAFARQPSFQFASYQSHVKKLEAECRARRSIGIQVELLDKNDVAQKFKISKPAGILSKNGAQLDAYALSHELLHDVEQRGNKVYDHSPVTSINHLKNGIEAVVMNKFRIKCKKLVIACGYESQQYLPKKVEQLSSTYAVISERFSTRKFWYENALIWETATPYLYMKVTQDNRIAVGGKDVPFSSAARRDALLSSKAKQIQHSFQKLFPFLPFKIDFQWAGTFSNTKDGLPFIGCIPELPHTYFALGFGGNGITFSQIAAQLICDQFLGKKNPDMDIFSFNR